MSIRYMLSMAPKLSLMTGVRSLSVMAMCQTRNQSTGPNNDSPSDNSWKDAKSIYNFSAKDIDGNDVSLEKYKGHVCIVVNVSSKCALTKPNYTQLQKMYLELGESKGLKILAFPCNQFASQEPGTNAEIKKFATETYNVTFDMFSKIDVNSSDAHPLWSYMKDKQSGFLGDFIKWNFTKFLVDKNGQVVKRYGPKDEPKGFRSDLDKYF